MTYTEKQVFWWQPDSAHEKGSLVWVEGLRKRGSALLSNGWEVDQDGFAEGTQRRPGGRVFPVTGPAAGDYPDFAVWLSECAYQCITRSLVPPNYSFTLHTYTEWVDHYNAGMSVEEAILAVTGSGQVH